MLQRVLFRNFFLLVMLFSTIATAADNDDELSLRGAVSFSLGTALGLSIVDNETSGYLAAIYAVSCGAVDSTKCVYYRFQALESDGYKKEEAKQKGDKFFRSTCIYALAGMSIMNGIIYKHWTGDSSYIRWGAGLLSLVGLADP